MSSAPPAPTWIWRTALEHLRDQYRRRLVQRLSKNPPLLKGPISRSWLARFLNAGFASFGFRFRLQMHQILTPQRAFHSVPRRRCRAVVMGGEEPRRCLQPWGAHPCLCPDSPLPFKPFLRLFVCPFPSLASPQSFPSTICLSLSLPPRAAARVGGTTLLVFRTVVLGSTVNTLVFLFPAACSPEPNLGCPLFPQPDKGGCEHGGDAGDD